MAIIISAWDLTISSGLGPEDWLRQRAPLLAQYLDANGKRYPHRIFGVSAQGADLKSPGALVDVINASQRISVVTENNSNSDITAPVRWLLS